jgi:hypothetical protein
MIDADASPSGYYAWYNHYSREPCVRTIRPPAKNEPFGVQRMEMLAIYFALADNIPKIRKTAKRQKRRRVLIAVRSDSKSTVEQLRGMSEIRDPLMKRIASSISKLLATIKYTIVFDHLDRSRNMAGLLLEQQRRKERERFMERIVRAPLEPLLASTSGMRLMTSYIIN